MKSYFYIFFCCFFQVLVLAQNSDKESFETVKKRVSKVFFNAPLEARKDAYLLSRIAKTKEEKVISYQYLGYIYDLSGNSDSARYYFLKRLDYTKRNFLKTNLYYQSVIDFCNWGTSYVDGNVLVKELISALSDIDEKKFSQEKGLMFMLMGDIFLKDFEYEKAEKYYDKSFSLIKGKYVKTDYFMRKADIDILKTEYTKAKEDLLKGLASFKEKNIYTYPLYLNKLGHVSLLLGEYKKAKQYLEESLLYQNKNGFNNLSSQTYLNLYNLEKENQVNKTLEKKYLDQALAYNGGDISVLKDIYLGYKDYYSRENNLVKENEFLNKFKKLNDSIFNIEKVKVKTDIESRYQLNESKKEIALKESIIKKDKRIKLLYSIGVVVLLIFVIALIIFYLLKLRIQKRLRENQKTLHEEQLKLMLENQRVEIIKEKIKAKVEERGRLSLELHDGIASEIGALKLTISKESTLDKLEIESVVNKIDKLYNEVRNLSHDLDPDNIDCVEFSQFVENLCMQIEKNGLETIKELYITKRIDGLDAEVLVNVYRIIQEVTANILKHALATKVVFDVVESMESLYIHINDNGIGYNLNDAKKGIGLKNIEKRVKNVGGKLEISSNNNGTDVKITIPMERITP